MTFVPRRIAPPLGRAGQAPALDEAVPAGRAPEIEEATNRILIHPVARRLTPLLARLHVPPNAVSLAGMACGVLAGIAYNHDQDRRWAVAGLLLMTLWHLMDGIDGQLARLTGRHSQFGKVLDGICDYVTFTSVYLGLALALDRREGAWMWVLVVAAGVSHAAQAAAYEAQRQDYDFFGWGRGSPTAADPGSRPAGPPASTVGASAGARRMLASMLQPGSERAASIRRQYRAAFAPVVRRWSVLSANWHTIGIFCFAVLKLPLWYFVFETCCLNTVLIVLLAGQRGRYRSFLSRLQVSDRDASSVSLRSTGAAGGSPARSPGVAGAGS